MKFGAFNPCEKCGVVPHGEDELAVSLAISDHYCDQKNLEQIGANIATGKTMSINLSSNTGSRHLLTADQFTQAGKELMKAGKFADAVHPLRSAADLNKGKEEIWQDLVVAASAAGQHVEAIDFSKQGLQNHPRSDWLWRKLGAELMAVDRLDEAEKAFLNAENLKPDAPWLWRCRAQLYEKKQETDKQINALEILDEFGEASGEDLNSLGIAHHNQGNFAKALHYYGRSAQILNDPAPRRNMGLVYSHPEVSQDVDAADAYRRLLEVHPDYELAKRSLAAIKKKLISLAESAVPLSEGLLAPNDCFQFYVNPFEALNASVTLFPDPTMFADLTADELYLEIDEKLIQRARTLLLSEIKLEEGVVNWMDNAKLDAARVQEVCAELDSEEMKRYHWYVYRNDRLLRFLTRGDIRHFVYEDSCFPTEALELMDEDSGFLEFLSHIFARQFNLVLTRAIDRQLYPVIEALLDGRRWVLPRHEDECFAGAYKRTDNLVQLIETKAHEAETEKPNLSALKALLTEQGVIKLFNLLPAAFRSQQTRVVAALRSIALVCHNEHGDTDLAQAVLIVSQQFRFKSVELTQRLKEDLETVQKLIADQRKDECKVQFGKERKFEITKDGVLDGQKFFLATSVEAVRWGILVSNNGNGISYDYLLSIRNDQNISITASWKSNEAGEAESTRYFDSMVRAAFAYLASHVIEKINTRICSGDVVEIGLFKLDQTGVTIVTKGILFKRKDIVPWSDFITKLSHGDILASRESDGTTFAPMPIRDTENAVLLPLIRLRFQPAAPSKETKQPTEKPKPHPTTTPDSADEKCEKCGQPMLKRYSRFGPFLGCSGYPTCKNIKKLAPENNLNKQW